MPIRRGECFSCRRKLPRPVVHPIRPVFGEFFFVDDPVLALAYLVELPLVAHDLADRKSVV